MGGATTADLADTIIVGRPTSEQRAATAVKLATAFAEQGGVACGTRRPGKAGQGGVHPAKGVIHAHERATMCRLYPTGVGGHHR